MIHRNILTIFLFLAVLTSITYAQASHLFDWEDFKLCCEGRIPSEYTAHQEEIAHAIEYEINIEIIEEIHSFKFPQNQDYQPHANEHTPAYPSSYGDSSNQSNFSFSVGAALPNIPQCRPARDHLSLRAAHFKDPELTNVIYYHEGCASWDQQRYWDAAFKLFGEWCPRNLQLKASAEYQYVYTVGSHYRLGKGLNGKSIVIPFEASEQEVLNLCRSFNTKACIEAALTVFKKNQPIILKISLI